MKLLVVVSSLDLTQPFSATPAWWQLLKGLYESGVEVIATPYQGPAIDSLWWRSAPNPARWQGDAFKFLRNRSRAVLRPRISKALPADTRESLAEKAIRKLAQSRIGPLWRNHLDSIIRQEPDIKAVLFLTVPLNHLTGIPRFLSEQYSIPVFYYDGDVPASLPNMRGFASGFRIYQGADLSEYTAFISNSAGGEQLLRQLGARNAHTIWYGADPDVFSPLTLKNKDIDVFFYGHGREYRSDWIDKMIKEPSTQMTASRFAVRGNKLGDLGKAQQLPYLSFSKLREYICRSKLNLCITRGAHASVYASSSSRPFELAALGACIIANPYMGLDAWFETEKEIVLVSSAEEAIERYRYLLANAAEREAIGAAARQRVLRQHTFRHRARELISVIQQYI